MSNFPTQLTETMKFSPTSTSFGAIIATAIACASPSLNAATQVTSNVVVASSIDNNTSTTLPHTIPSGKGTVNGTAVALAGSVAPAAGDITYTGGSSLSADTNGTGNNNITYDSTITHTVTFSLLPNEAVNINFTGNYALTSAFLSSQVSYTLTAPGGANLWTPKLFTSSGTVAADNIPLTAINESVSNVSSLAGGNYTLTLVTRIFGGYSGKNVNVGTADFTNLNLVVSAVAVPEPSSSLVFGMLASCMLLARRRK